MLKTKASFAESAKLMLNLQRDANGSFVWPLLQESLAAFVQIVRKFGAFGT